MSSTKHTPGPWRYEKGEHLFSEEVHCGPGSIVAPDTTGDNGGQDWNICLIHDGFGDGEREANAALIAAAPDMLAALKAVRDNVRDDAPGMWAQVDEAIDKAEGKS